MIKRGDGRVSVWCKAEPGAQSVFIDEMPDVYYVPPYVGHKGWIGIRLDIELDVEELRERIIESYVLVAPRKLGKLIT